MSIILHYSKSFELLEKYDKDELISDNLPESPVQFGQESLFTLSRNYLYSLPRNSQKHHARLLSGLSCGQSRSPDHSVFIRNVGKNSLHEETPLISSANGKGKNFQEERNRGELA
ncbi:MAG: hypothetical protein R6U03_07250 [Gillisia sp.]